MRPSFKNGFYAGLLAAFILGLWLARLWGAENQVRLHNEHLIRAIEKAHWSGLGDFIASDYHDQWGDGRTELLARLRLILRLTSSLTITASEPQMQVERGEGTWRARIHVEGEGEAAAEISARVNGLTTPFELHWRRKSWKPWDWKLVGVSNTGLEIPKGEF